MILSHLSRSVVKEVDRKRLQVDGQLYDPGTYHTTAKGRHRQRAEDLSGRPVCQASARRSLDPIQGTTNAHKHPLNSLRWSANQDGQRARCTDCNLKSVIYWTAKHGAMMVVLAHENLRRMFPSQPRCGFLKTQIAIPWKPSMQGGRRRPRCFRATKTPEGQVIKKLSGSGYARIVGRRTKAHRH